GRGGTDAKDAGGAAQRPARGGGKGDRGHQGGSHEQCREHRHRGSCRHRAEAHRYGAAQRHGRRGGGRGAQAIKGAAMEELWVAIAFVIFVAVLGYFGVHRLILKALDDRQARIKAELDDAQRLKQEAEALLAHYRSRQQEAEREAESIIAGAQAEAERLMIEAKARMEEFVARRTKL